MIGGEPSPEQEAAQQAAAQPTEQQPAQPVQPVRPAEQQPGVSSFADADESFEPTQDAYTAPELPKSQQPAPVDEGIPTELPSTESGFAPADAKNREAEKAVRDKMKKIADDAKKDDSSGQNDPSYGGTPTPTFEQVK